VTPALPQEIWGSDQHAGGGDAHPFVGYENVHARPCECISPHHVRAFAGLDRGAHLRSCEQLEKRWQVGGKGKSRGDHYEKFPQSEVDVQPERWGHSATTVETSMLRSTVKSLANLSLSCGVCVDKIWRPSEAFTVAHPGDELTIAMPGARLVAHPRCTPACSLEVVITPAVCFQGSLLPKYKVDGLYVDAQRTVIAQDQPWTLTAAPGLYFLTVNGGEFSTPRGHKGEPSGTFGLLVDPDRLRTIADAASSGADCRASSTPDAGADAAASDADGGAASDGG